MKYSVMLRRKRGKTHMSTRKLMNIKRLGGRTAELKRYKPCQDYGMVIKHGAATIILAADGHGGSPYARSQLGSRIVCGAAARLLTQGVPHEEFPARLKAEFDRLTAKHLRFRPVTQDERERLRVLRRNCSEPVELPEQVLYGTTFLAAVLEPESCRAYRLGDGEVHLMKRDGTFFPMLPADPACKGNVTSSMIYSSESALEHFASVRFDEPAAAAFVFTDGYRHILTRPNDALRLFGCTGADERGRMLDDVLKRGFRRDDQTFIFAFDADTVNTPEFRSGLRLTSNRAVFEHEYCGKMLKKVEGLASSIQELSDSLKRDMEKLRRIAQSNPDCKLICESVEEQIEELEQAGSLLSESGLRRWERC